MVHVSKPSNNLFFFKDDEPSDLPSPQVLQKIIDKTRIYNSTHNYCISSKSLYRLELMTSSKLDAYTTRKI